MGWAGQSEAPACALQMLSDDLGDEGVWEMVRRSLDHICAMPIEKTGFPVRFGVETGKWHSPDPVSEGQAMNSIALAIRAGRKNKRVDVSSWEHFLQKVCDIHSARLLADSWAPRNTAEAFYIAPMLIAAELFDNQQ